MYALAFCAYVRACTFQVLYIAMHCGFAFGRLLLLRRAIDEDVGSAPTGASSDVPSDSDLVGVLFNPFWVSSLPATCTIHSTALL